MEEFILSRSQLFDLEERRREKMHDLAVIIQKIFKGWKFRTRVSDVMKE